MSGLRLDSTGFQRGFLLMMTIGVSLLFFKMISAYVMALLLAAIFSALLHPVFRRLVKLFRGRKGPAAGVTLVLVLVLILGPLATFTTIVVKEAIEVSDAVRPWVQEQLKSPGELQRLLERIPFADRLLPYRDELITKGGELAGKAANIVMNTAAAGAVGTTRFILALFVMLYAMYFFLIDGRAVLEKVLYYLPLTPEDEERMLDEFTSVSRATIKGTLVIGIIQGALAGTAFAVAGVKGAVFWGTVMAVLSVIPGIGSALIWVPAVIYLALTGHVGAAIGLFLWCALVVGTVDNVLRPRLVGQDTKMPDLLILISTLGGLTMFGAMGIVIGPVIAALFLTLWDLYGVAFADMLPPPALVTASAPSSGKARRKPRKGKAPR